MTFLFSFMNKFILLLLAVLASSAFLVPFAVFDKEFVKVDIFTSDTQILLSSEYGEITFPFFTDSVYDSDNPFDFFSELVDSSNIQQLQLLPYHNEVSCNVKFSQNSNLAGNYNFCLILATRLGIPLYVHKDLLVSPIFSLKENL